MDTAELVRKLRLPNGTTETMKEAADTIERLQAFKDAYPEMQASNNKLRKHLTNRTSELYDARQERDAALKEVKRLKDELTAENADLTTAYMAGYAKGKEYKL